MAGIQSRGRRTLFARICALLLALLVFLGWPGRSAAYAVLAHEAIIDSAWDTNIRPLLLKRFPQATPAELKEAHGYAYGGAIIQDMGYYPHGNKLFSDLTHYVRSGDFVLALLRDSKDLDDYAFALGALSHYAADNQGHRIGVNRSVPLLYPKMDKKYGDVVTYEENPLDHVKTEFGFDVIEVAQGRYASTAYHDFIGFGVAVPLLEQAFQETYGLSLKSVLTDENKVLGSYRYDVSRLLPKATRVAWSLKKDDIERDQPGITKKQFLYNIKRSSYRRYWGKDYQPPTLGERFTAFIIRIVPKIGPLAVLQLKTPTPQTEQMFEASFNAALDHYRKLLDAIDAGQKPEVPNDNFDTGAVTGPGEYRLNDETQAKLLDALAGNNFSGASPEVRAELLQFFADPSAPYAIKRKKKEWERVQSEIAQLRRETPSTVAADASPSSPSR
ncbi:MAG TPA: zinc dependent phospholipase C family protein [Candidatus Baltobacteraceae bacterium]|nr:zinc dependent phospholipase C family protein [Candidatus Baltobacteraceae bacterium]